MKTKFNIKNFRVFDENGVSFEINPITILTGSNSSGKSSVVKAILLLNSFLAQIRTAIENGDPVELDKYKLDFTKYPNNLLGRFDKVVNENSETKKITFEYTMHSLMISKDVTVQLVFTDDENDELNNAYLESVSLSFDGKEFYSSKKGDYTYCNINAIKDSGFDFLLAEYVVKNYCNLESNYEFEGKISEEEYKTECKKTIEFLRGYDKYRRDDIFRYIRIAKRDKSMVHLSNCSAQAVAEAKDKNTFFVIPLLEQLSAINKTEIRDYIDSHFLKSDDEALKNVSHRILDSFIASDFENFEDYFLDAENRYFEHFRCGKHSPFRTSFLTSVHLASAKEMGFEPEYISMAPHNFGIAYSIFNEDNEPSEAEKLAEKQKRIEDWEKTPIDFAIIYEAVMMWNRISSKDSTIHYTYIEPSTFDPFGFYYHHTYKVFTSFVDELLKEIVCPDWCANMSYVSSSRANVSRLYTLDNSSDFSILLQNYFEKKRLFEQSYKERSSISRLKRKYRANEFMNRWIRKFEIGEAIRFRADREGLGVSIRLYKTHKSKGRLLADEGYGITQLVSILLQIETAILSAKGEKVNNFFRMENLDKYDTDKFHYEVNTIAIEEPEIHLHPKYQSLLTDMFLEAYEKYNIHFIIETHSEYLIRKAQVFVARRNYENEETMNKENPFKVYYVPRGEKPYEMTFGADGRFKNEFGKGFFDEATNLAFEIL